MTREEALQLLALCEKATAEPWTRFYAPHRGHSPTVAIQHDGRDLIKWPGFDDQPNAAQDAAFIAAARTKFPCALRDVLRLQDELADHVGFLEVLDAAGVTMNGMTPSEALAKLRQIAGGPDRSA
jgi:hypothetical protein